MKTRVALLQEQKTHLVSLMDALAVSKETIFKAIDKTANALESVKLDLANEMVELERKMRHDEYHIMLEEETE